MCVVYSFLNIFFTLTFGTMSSYIFYHITLEVVKLIRMYIFNRLYATIFVVITMIKVEAGLEFLPKQYHKHLRRLPPAPVAASSEYADLYDYFLKAKEVRVAKQGGGLRSGRVSLRSTGQKKCFLEKHASRYGSLLLTCRRLEREGKHLALVVLLRLAMRTVLEPVAVGERLPWARPQLVSDDMSGGAIVLGEDNDAEKEKERSGMRVKEEEEEKQERVGQ